MATNPEIGGAIHIPDPKGEPPSRAKQRGQRQLDSRFLSAAQPQTTRSAAIIPFPGQDNSVTHFVPAGATITDESHGRCETPGIIALVGNIAIECRRYDDLRRAKQRVLLQAMAMCRYACDGDKNAGAKLYAEIHRNPLHPVGVWLMPYFEAMKPLESAIKVQEKTIAKMARQLPVWGWADGILGLSDRFLGMIVGECGAPVGSFKSVSAVWKRMGLAVIAGGRQRRVTGERAIEHGYVARRRSLMWNIGESIIKAQVRKDSADPERRVGIAELGALYLDRKAYEAVRCQTAAHAHNSAKRYIEKRLLRELWKAWRAA